MLFSYASKWTTSWENLFMPYANNKGTDQPAHPRSLISAFVVRSQDSIISPVCILAISWLSLTSVAEQVGLSLTWSKTPGTGFLRMGLKFCFVLLKRSSCLIVFTFIAKSHLSPTLQVWDCSIKQKYSFCNRAIPKGMLIIPGKQIP